MPRTYAIIFILLSCLPIAFPPQSYAQSPKRCLGAELAPQAFNGAYIEKLTLNEGLESIGAWACNMLEGLTELIIPHSVKNIGEYAFCGCNKLRSITIPEGVEHIGKYAFHLCSCITELLLPLSLKSVERNAFFLCNNLSKIYCRAKEKPAGWSEHWVDAFDSVEVLWDYRDGDIPPKQELAEKICDAPELYNSIELEDGSLIVTGFKHYVQILNAEGESEWVENPYDFSDVTVAVLPERTIMIEEAAFFGCVSLKKAVLPKSILYIGQNAFCRCFSLSEINLPEGLITVDAFAFSSCRALTGVTLPQSIKNMGASVFSGCSSMQEMRFPENRKDKLLYNWEKDCLAKVVYYRSEENGESLEREENFIVAETEKGCTLSALKDCWAREAIIPEGVTRIGKSAFHKCPWLTKVSLPSTVTSVAANAFEHCPNLGEISVAKNNPSYKSVDGVLYTKGGKVLVRYPMAKFGDFTLPSGVRKISENAFSGCHGLCSIVLHDNLTEIFKNAFSGCVRLDSKTREKIAKKEK
ncbi:MAG: leucine-rich repeat domain-containing protein [Clostridia bacterium]|nr:leucine-rich repeat domain-containing protein [Clostridia bacterium]